MQNKIRVRAKGDARLPVPGTSGRFVGRDKKSEILADGVLVTEDAYHLRAVKRGDLEIVSEAPAAPEEVPS